VNLGVKLWRKPARSSRASAGALSSCIFISQIDLDRHVAAFGDSKEAHKEAFRRVHGRADYGSAE
jgi:hypothetical protein